MNKSTLFFFILLAAGTALSATTTATPDQISPERLQRAIYRHTGGMVIKPGSAKGKITFVNAQKSAPDEWLRENADLLFDKTKFFIEIKNGTFSLPAPQVEGEATMFVVDDPALPSLLHAPENRWVMVNLRTLASGAGQKEPFFRARVKKELMRGFSLLAGAQNSQYPNSLMGCITKVEQLDDFIEAGIPVDVQSRFRSYLRGYGLIPAEEFSYRQACMEGWASSPTNTVQQKIWEKVHTPPEKPLKITYDKDKQKPVVK